MRLRKRQRYFSVQCIAMNVAEENTRMKRLCDHLLFEQHNSLEIIRTVTRCFKDNIFLNVIINQHKHNSIHTTLINHLFCPRKLLKRNQNNRGRYSNEMFRGNAHFEFLLSSIINFSSGLILHNLHPMESSRIFLKSLRYLLAATTPRQRKINF